MLKKLKDSIIKNAKLKPDGKQKTIALGTYPDTGLKEARDFHEAARKLLAAGIGPCLDKKARKRARAKLTENSFEVVAREWFDKFSMEWVEAGRKRVLRACS